MAFPHKTLIAKLIIDKAVTDPTFLESAANWLENLGQCNGCLTLL